MKTKGQIAHEAYCERRTHGSQHGGGDARPVLRAPQNGDTLLDAYEKVLLAVTEE